MLAPGVARKNPIFVTRESVAIVEEPCCVPEMGLHERAAQHRPQSRPLHVRSVVEVCERCIPLPQSGERLTVPHDRLRRRKGQ